MPGKSSVQAEKGGALGVEGIHTVVHGETLLQRRKTGKRKERRLAKAI